MWISLFLGGASLLGLGMGGFISTCINNFMPKKLPYMYITCGGMLAGIIFFEMIPHTLEEYDMKGILIGLLAGYVIMLLVDYFLHSYEKTYSSKKTLGFLVIAIFFHNIIMGFSYGAVSISTSQPFLTAMVIHQIPEGIAIMITLLIARLKIWSFLYIIIILSVVLAVSALVGETIIGTSIKLDTLLIGNAIGTLVFVTFHEIIGKSTGYFRWRSLLFLIVIGMVGIKAYLSILGL